MEYKEFCRKQGYAMTHLPDAFSTKFAAEIEVLDREMSRSWRDFEESFGVYAER